MGKQMNLKGLLSNSEENTKIIIKNTIGSFGVKGLSMLIALFTTPAYISYFNNNEILGVWFTILSVLSWILNCDMGIGNGLRNQLVYALTANDKLKARRYISSSYLFLVIVGAIVTTVVALIGNLISWNKVFNISEVVMSRSLINKAMIILLISIMMQFILRLATSILYALQKSFLPGFINLCTNAIMLVVVLFCNFNKCNNDFILLAVVYLIAVNIPLVFATIWIFKVPLKEMTPSTRYFKMDYAKSVLKVGGIFLWLQLISLVVDNTNSYLITIFINNEAVVEYQIYYKIFNLPLTMVLLLSTSLWSTITKAKAEKNWNWLSKTYRRFLQIGVISSICEFAIIIPLQFIFNLWLGKSSISVNYEIALIFAISGSIMLWRTILATFSNGLCELNVQAVFMTIGAIINIPLAYIAAQITNSYISIVIANIISMVPYCLVQTAWFSKYFKKRRPAKPRSN